MLCLGATSLKPLPPLSCLKELEQVLIEEWMKIPLDEVRKLYDFILR